MMYRSGLTLNREGSGAGVEGSFVAGSYTVVGEKGSSKEEPEGGTGDRPGAALKTSKHAFTDFIRKLALIARGIIRRDDEEVGSAGLEAGPYISGGGFA